jgi:diguanylate cyclase (GGDEF)-like protein/PAS domain S-box-containing protein
VKTMPPLNAGDEDAEITALIATLHESARRLEFLTDGEVDAVSDRQGHTFLLRHAQDHLRHREAEKQVAILNALPANIALLDSRGVIVSVNEAWRRFASTHLLQSPGYAIGLNYLEICNQVPPRDPSAAHVAAGIRAVLSRKTDHFSIEYPCHSPTEKRWFVCLVTPLTNSRLNGAVVMHLDISERKLAQEALVELSHKTEQRERVLSTTLASITDFAYIFDRDGRFQFANQPLLDMWGATLEAIVGKNSHDLGYSFDLAARLLQQIQQVFETRTVITDEAAFTTPAGQDGYYEYILSPVVAADGSVEFVVGSTRDITQRKQAEIEISRINEGLRNSEIRIKYLNRVHAVLSGINTLIVRVRDRDELFREACRIAVEDGGFHIAGLGLLDRATTKIVPVAMAGKDEELLDAIKSVLSSDDGESNTETTMAIRENKPFVSNDAQHDPRIQLGRKYADAGVRSLAVFPLIVSGDAVGAFALYADEIEFFHEEEMGLLNELCGDIAFAIDHIGKVERLNYLAYYDELTGLPNRSLFLDRVTQHIRGAVSGGHHLALLLFDLERFKNVNDSLGRSAGDALLKQVAEWLTLETGDANLLARVGADQFAVMLVETKTDGAVARYLEKINAALANHPFQLDDSVFRIAAKAGVALFPDDGQNVDTLFQHAEAALRKAKANGSRYLFYNKTMSDKIAGKLNLESKLRLALDNDEFVLHYQPKIHIASGMLTGAEALIRWNDPQTGLVQPMLFIPLLEETGLIHEVGRWALQKAIEDYLSWCNAGLAAVRIAVNVSPLQLRDHGFVDEIRQAISIDVRASAGLELEITESMAMEDIKHGIASLQAIRSMGVTTAIDDFGTGFSSLSYLSTLPIDTLKIDRSFIVGMTDTPHGRALVSAIINLAHALQLKVVAEGVKTKEQRSMLQLLRCDEMQGFLFSKPVPGDIFAEKFLALNANAA